MSLKMLITKSFCNILPRVGYSCIRSLSNKVALLERIAKFEPLVQTDDYTYGKKSVSYHEEYESPLDTKASRSQGEINNMKHFKPLIDLHTSPKPTISYLEEMEMPTSQDIKLNIAHGKSRRRIPAYKPLINPQEYVHKRQVSYLEEQETEFKNIWEDCWLVYANQYVNQARRQLYGYGAN